MKIQICLMIIVVLFLQSCKKFKEISASAKSPNGNYKVLLIEKKGMDRNFFLELENLFDGKKFIIFNSPDEGLPIGTEKLFWSSDSRYILLLGKHFYTVDGTPLANGDFLYLLYDTKKQILKCNARQLNSERFSWEDVSKIDFGNKLKDYIVVREYTVPSDTK